MAPSKYDLRPRRTSRPEFKPRSPVTQDLQAFHFFPRLPVELRLEIYSFALTRRIVSLLSLEIVKCNWVEICAVPDLRYPLPQHADLFHQNGSRRSVLHATLEHIFPRTASVPLLEVCVESRKHVFKYYDLFLDPQSSTRNEVRRDADIVEDPRAERSWAGGRYIDSPRFIVRKMGEAVSRINYDLNIVRLDQGELNILYIAEKWLPQVFKKKVKYLALTVEQCFQRSTEPTYGPCLFQFTALEELILLV